MSIFICYNHLMNISEIYKKYKITPLLQQHQLRAASVGAYIADHWNIKQQIDKDGIIQTLLLHDMGNIIKFDFDDSELNPSDEKEYWKAVQKEFVEKYGHDEHIATNMIAKEIGVTAKVEY